MRHQVLLVLTVLVCAAIWKLGLGWSVLVLAVGVVGGLLALVMLLCIIAAGAESDAARTSDRDLHEPEEL